MKFCDSSPSVLEWSSEEVVIPYFSSIDHKMHRYYVDFWVRLRTKEGGESCKLIEIKPYRQTIPPKTPKNSKRPNSKFIKEMKTWAVNNHKWQAASKYCNERQWEFMILTEKQLFKKDKKKK